MIAQVIPARRMPLSLLSFDYIVPIELEDKIAAGQLVVIPFQSHNEFGIVYKLFTSSRSGRPLKAVKEIVSKKPFICTEQLNFLAEMSEFYHTPLGSLIKSNLPPLQKRKLGNLSKLNDDLSWGLLTRVPSTKTSAKPKLLIYKNIEEKASYLGAAISPIGQTLILVPELSDIERLVKLLGSEFKNKIAIITGELGQKEIYKLWFDIWEGKKNIIVGTRRALFLPFFDLRTIIIDDEGNGSYKSWDMAPRFHTRDAALFLTTSHNATLHLLSHTPSVESFYFGEHGVYDKINSGISELSKNYEFINIKDERRSGNNDILGEDIQKQLKINAGTSFLYLNRKGTLNYVCCRDCGKVSSCRACERPLAYYENSGDLKCHHCDYSEKLQINCVNCGGARVAMYGAGIALLEKEVKRLLKDTGRKIIRLDKEKNEASANDYGPGTVLLGTQYAWSKINWDKLTLMAFVDADISLFVPEFKISEQLWQLLRDARFRLPKHAPLYIQTSHPEHAIFQSLFMPESFYDNELAHRKIFGYPPYNFLLRFFHSNPNKNAAEFAGKTLYQKLAGLTKGLPEIKIHPAAAMFPPHHKNLYWQVILAKISYKNYKKNTKFLLGKIPNEWKVDPNPSTILSI